MHTFWRRERKKKEQAQHPSSLHGRSDTPNSWKERKKKKTIKEKKKRKKRKEKEEEKTTCSLPSQQQQQQQQKKTIIKEKKNLGKKKKTENKNHRRHPLPRTVLWLQSALPVTGVLTVGGVVKNRYCTRGPNPRLDYWEATFRFQSASE